MKKLIVVLALVAFVAAGSVALAGKKAAGVCCVKGEVKELSAADCKKAGRKIVKDAKACKPMKKK